MTAFLQVLSCIKIINCKKRKIKLYDCFTTVIEEKSSKPAEPKPVKKVDLSKVEIEPLFTDYVDFETFSKSDFRAVKIKECFAVPKSKKLLQFTVNDGSGVDRTILSGIHEWYEPEELVGKTARITPSIVQNSPSPWRADSDTATAYGHMF